MIDKLKEYITNNLESDTIIKFNRFKYNKENASCTVCMEEAQENVEIDATYLDYEFDNNENYETDTTFCNETIQKRKSSRIDDFINETKTDNKFQRLLFKYIDDRNLKDSDVYNKVNIDRRLFSKIRSNENYHPSKETVILLGLALELSEEEFISLLDSASYSLPKNNIYDLIIRFCFIEHIYDVINVNELLNEYNCNLLNAN